MPRRHGFVQVAPAENQVAVAVPSPEPETRSLVGFLRRQADKRNGLRRPVCLGAGGGSDGSESNFIAPSPRSLQRAPILRDTRLLEEHCPACTMHLHCTAAVRFIRAAAPARQISRRDRTWGLGGLKKILLVLQLSSCKVCRRHGIRVGSPRQQQHPKRRNDRTTGG